MRADEFSAYRNYFIADYGGEISRNYDKPLEHALKLAEEDIEQEENSEEEEMDIDNEEVKVQETIISDLEGDGQMDDLEMDLGSEAVTAEDVDVQIEDNMDQSEPGLLSHVGRATEAQPCTSRSV